MSSPWTPSNVGGLSFAIFADLEIGGSRVRSAIRLRRPCCTSLGVLATPCRSANQSWCEALMCAFENASNIRDILSMRANDSFRVQAKIISHFLGCAVACEGRLAAKLGWSPSRVVLPDCFSRIMRSSALRASLSSLFSLHLRRMAVVISLQDIETNIAVARRSNVTVGYFLKRAAHILTDAAGIWQERLLRRLVYQIVLIA